MLHLSEYGLGGGGRGEAADAAQSAEHGLHLSHEHVELVHLGKDAFESLHLSKSMERVKGTPSSDSSPKFTPIIFYFFFFANPSHETPL